MDATGRPDHIEDVLVKLHKGQWFGWSDSQNKVHKNLIIHHADKSKPTKASLEKKLVQAQADWDWRMVREKRNAMLRDSDYIMMADYPLEDKSDWENYRQELRNIPQTFSDDVNKVEYPSEPS
jgi:hypothetical protein